MTNRPAQFIKRFNDIRKYLLELDINKITNINFEDDRNDKDDSYAIVTITRIGLNTVKVLVSATNVEEYKQLTGIVKVYDINNAAHTITLFSMRGINYLKGVVPNPHNDFNVFAETNTHIVGKLLTCNN